MERRRFFQALMGGTAAILGTKLKAIPTGFSGARTVEDSIPPLATKVLGPIKAEQRDYMSLARRAFCVVNGDSVSSLNDLHLHCVSGSGIVPISGAGGSALSVPPIEITSHFLFPIKHVEERRGDLIIHGLRLAKSEIGAVEDRHMLSLFDAVVKDDIPFGPRFLDEARERFSGQGVENAFFIFANPYDATEIIRLKDRLGYDGNYVRKTLKTGVIGWIGGTTVCQSRVVPKGRMYITGGTEDTVVENGIDNAIHAGYVADKTTLYVVSSSPKPDHYGFLLMEESGFAVNPAAVQRVSMEKWPK